MIFQRADWLGVLQTVLFFVLQNSPESVCYYTACFAAGFAARLEKLLQEPTCFCCLAATKTGNFYV